MKPSFSYYIVTNFIKLKGIKNIFNQEPIDYKSLRKDDVYNPKNKLLVKNHNLIQIKKSKIHQFTKSTSKQLVIYIHGGAFVSGPAKHHWDTIAKIFKDTDQNIWFIDYPKAPETRIQEVSDNIKTIYKTALEQFDKDQISIIGDSAGGTLIIKLIQQIEKESYPKQIILISPVLDASLSNEKIKSIEPNDIMLAIKGVKSAKKISLGSDDLTSHEISPINGVKKQFPKTTLFIGTFDITSIDQMLFAELLKNNNTALQVIKKDKMPHIWPLLPIMKESKLALNQILDLLK